MTTLMGRGGGSSEEDKDEMRGFLDSALRAE